MESFKIQWSSSTIKDLRSLPPHEVARIIAAVEQLGAIPLPRESQKLAGSDRTYRIDWAIIVSSMKCFKTLKWSKSKESAIEKMHSANFALAACWKKQDP